MRNALPILLLASALRTGAATLTLIAPVDYQVIQRESWGSGFIQISGQLSEGAETADTVEVRIITEGVPNKWEKLSGAVQALRFGGKVRAPAGGWHRVEVRVTNAGNLFADAAVEHVGIGEVFVVTGQSNSGNHGEEKQTTTTGLVSASDGKGWRLANDPQPGASGGRGSFMPPLGDALATRFKVPIGFIACGAGGTSVREWLPKGATFTNPPTVLGNVQQRVDGQWESGGRLFENLVARMKQAGPNGFRAVLWHQGESDANQADPTRTLAGSLYREYLKTTIRESRREIGWKAPWFVAQASYHVPGDEGSPDIRDAQSSLWKDGTALEGPDSDALKGSLRENGGKGVHFSGPGLREHAARWVDKVAPWLEQQKNLERP